MPERRSTYRVRSAEKYVRPPRAASSTAIAASMRGNRSRDTKPEIAIRHELSRLGLRGYRIDAKWLPGRPDVAFTKHKVALFVHGCFWHRCPHCNLPMPKTNPSYWQWKFRRNSARDELAVRDLEEMGWRPLRIWGCEVSRSVEECAERVQRVVEAARDAS